MKKSKLLVAAAIFAETLALASPTIQFTYVPPIGSYDNVQGKVTGVSPNAYGVALFIEIYGTYWTKPYYDEPVITLASDGTFSVNLVTGGIDAYAEQILAYVVPLGYSNTIPIIGNANSIPAEIPSNSVASAVANKFAPINWSANQWEVKNTGYGAWGPGPNYFTNANVNIDAQGRMHLSVSYSDNEWRCAEIILTNSYGYGTYRIWLDDDLSSLPTNIVFGFFTWDNFPTDNEDTYQELDIEFSNGSVVGAPKNWQYVVQPYEYAGNRTNFSAPAIGMSNSTHTITWTPDAVYYESYTNHVADQRTFSIQSSTDLINWTPVLQTNAAVNSTNTVVISGPKQKAQFYRAQMGSFAGTPAPFKSAWLTNGVPVPGNDTHLHLNLWLFQGSDASPSTADSYEVVISKFEFIPFTNIEPKLQITQAATNQTKLLLKYRVN